MYECDGAKHAALGQFLRKPTMMKNLLSCILFLGLTTSLSGQDAVFSQFYAAPLRLNPALVGVGVAPRIHANYRQQYAAWPNAYETYAISYEQPFENKPYSLGISLLTDRQADGVYRNNSFQGVYSYEVKVNKSTYVRMGLSAGLLQTQVDFSQLVFGDVLDPINGNTGGISEEMLAASSKISFDAGMGMVVYAKNLYAGFAVDHLTRPDESLLEINPNIIGGRPMRFTFHAGGQFSVKRYNNRLRPSYIAPSILFSRQAGFRQLVAGAYWGWGPLFIGSYYRHAFGNPDAAIGLVGVKQGVFRIGYSYDATISQLRAAPGSLGGVHEIGISIDLGDSEQLKKKRFKSRFNDCFGMFN